MLKNNKLNSHMSFHYKKFFNLIEIAMALGIIGFGVASVMSVFPVALKTSRDAMNDSYCADFADQFVHYIAYKATDSSNPNSWDIITGLPTSKPPAGDDAPTGAAHMGDIYGTVGGVSGVYAVQTETFVDNVSSPDMDASIRVWTSSMKVPQRDGSIRTLAVATEGAALNVEISWPISKPYARRETRNFYYTVIKP